MDHYKTLGVAKTATPDEIKKAYRKLASQHHPDKGGDTAMFQKIEEAYRILSDPQQRQQYDSPSPFGHNPTGGWQQAGFPGGFNFNFNGTDLNDIFSQMFNQHQQRHPNTPHVYRTVVQLTLEQSYFGGSMPLKLQTNTQAYAVNIDIPKSVTDGGQVRYDNLIPNAGLIVEFRVQPHLRFERKGMDLYCNQQISVLDLIVGTTFEFVTISGKTLEVRVPPKTQPHMQLKIAGEGMPIHGSTLFGDQIILLKPFVPDKIDDEITQSILRSKSK
jgi:DnaJ-class molecular chaperone